MKSKARRVALAYSGGLDTSVIVRWLIEKYGCEVVCFAADLGQGDELDRLESRAKSSGATKLVVSDLREEFTRDYIFPMLRSSAKYESAYLLGTAIARPLIAAAQTRVALDEDCDALAHGATGKGNDQVRFELTYAALAPELKVIAPWREWDIRSRSDALAYAKKWGIETPASRSRPWSMDRNLLHLSFEGADLEDSWNEPNQDMFVLTKSPFDAPDEKRAITIDFESGDPVALDSERLSPARLLSKLNEIGAENGIGRADIVENRMVGMKSRGVYETPGGTILYHARRAIEALTLDREELRLKERLAPDYAAMVYNGFWFSPERKAAQALIDATQKNVFGTVRLILYKGNVILAGSRSDRSLYDPRYSTFEADDLYDQSDAAGFIKLHSLRFKIAGARAREGGADSGRS